MNKYLKVFHTRTNKQEKKKISNDIYAYNFSRFNKFLVYLACPSAIIIASLTHT